MILDDKNITEEITSLFNKFSVYKNISLNDTNVFKEALDIFKYDYQRYFNTKDIQQINFLSRIELIGILFYRIARIYFLNKNETYAMYYANTARVICGFEIYYSADIGPGLKINHGLGTVLGARCKVGQNVTIHQGVTLGDKNGGRPTIGDNVIIYAGAKILGGITVGDNSIVAANSTCFSNVPNNSVAVGSPTRIL